MNFNTLDPNVILKAFGGADNNDLIHILNLVPTYDNPDDILIPNRSNYHDIDGMINFLEAHQDSVTVLSLNIRSFFKNNNKLLTVLEKLHENKLSFDVICIQECWLADDVDVNQLQINQYKLFHQGFNPECSTRGGLMCYVNNELTCNTISTYNKFKTWEGLFIEIKINNVLKITVGNIYRPPHDEVFNLFLEEFLPVVESVNRSASNLLLTGDFNIDLLKVNSCKNYQTFYDIMMGLHLIPTITFPTRFPEKITDINVSLLDQIYIKMSGALKNYEAGILFSPISDHLPTFSAIQLSNINWKPKPKHIKVQNHTKKACSAFIAELSSQNWPDIFNHDINSNPELSYSSFKNKVVSLQEKHFPVKTVRFNKYKHKLHNWTTDGILNSIKHRDKLYKQKNSTTKGTVLYLERKNTLQAYNNILNKLIREAKSNYYGSKFDKYKNDSRKTWDTINEILHKNKTKSQLPNYFNINGDHISEPKVIADNFNSFFVNIGPNLANNIDINNKPSFESYLRNKPNTKFHFDVINKDTILKIMKNMKPKSSCGIDKMSLKLLKLGTPHIIEPLTVIINQSLTSGIFPDDLKIAKVIPIFKKGDEHIFDNFRPISLLPSISKIFEKVAHKQLFSYLTLNKLLYKHQYGFRDQHSTELAVLEFIDRLYDQLDSGKIPIAIFIDLSKAFDTIDHNILCTKLYHYGVEGTENKWFKSYLTNRTQYVDFVNTESKLENITTGVPQGSILGPLLFTLYMNDICYASSFHSILFADDTTLEKPICIQDSSENINLELNKICDWLSVNKLSLNTKKTKYMIFHWHQNAAASQINFDLKIQDINIEKVSTFKFLGITLDSNLNWNEHVKELGNKLSRVNGVLRKLKNYIPSYILLTIYNSLFQSHLRYGITCWGFNNCSRLKKLQKRALRNVAKVKYNAHTEPIFKNLNLLKCDDIFKLSCIKLYYKFHNNILPEYFADFPFTDIRDNAENNRPRRIRACPDRFRDSQADLPNLNPIIQTIPTEKNNSRNCIRHFIPKLINDRYIPDIARDKIHTHSTKGFNDYTKNVIIQNYCTTCSIINCYICNHILLT